jgi:murein DD-endopeptidase MepM/ murein hydrolase activator NlpD
MKRDLGDRLGRALRTIGTGCLVIVMASATPAIAQEGVGTPEPGSVIVHVVQTGETLDGIAQRYGTVPEAVLAANGLPDGTGLYAGQRLVMPGVAGGAARFTVGAGDTLAAIAARYGVSIEELAQINRVANPSLLIAGQVLTIPAVPSHRPELLNLTRLTDDLSLWHVALRSRTNPTALMALNRISDPVVVAPGAILAWSGEGGTGHALRAPWVAVQLHPLPLETGHSGSLRIETTTPGILTATFMGADLEVVSDGITHIAMLSINRWIAPSVYPLAITFQGASGIPSRYSRPVLVAGGGYAQEIIRLSPDDVAVLSDTQAVQEESMYIAQLMSGYTPARQWDGLFQIPAAGVMSSGYGTARSYMGASYDSFHAGADFVAPTGTPIYAPANGIVVETGTLTIRGNLTVIDHGWGVYTGYWHQSGILVQPGDAVVAGQQIGTVGNSGLSTAAHLHWEMWVAGNQVDPLQWVREVFP